MEVDNPAMLAHLAPGKLSLGEGQLVSGAVVQQVAGGARPRPGLRPCLQAQAFEQQPLDGLGQAGLQDQRGGRRCHGGLGGGLPAMVDLAGVPALATGRGLRQQQDHQEQEVSRGHGGSARGADEEQTRGAERRESRWGGERDPKRSKEGRETSKETQYLKSQDLKKPSDMRAG